MWGPGTKGRGHRSEERLRETSTYQSLDTFFQNYYLAFQRQPNHLLAYSRIMEAVAKYDFKATADDELSFKRGDILKVTNTLTIKCFED